MVVSAPHEMNHRPDSETEREETTAEEEEQSPNLNLKLTPFYTYKYIYIYSRKIKRSELSTNSIRLCWMRDLGFRIEFRWWVFFAGCRWVVVWDSDHMAASLALSPASSSSAAAAFSSRFSLSRSRVASLGHFESRTRIHNSNGVVSFTLFSYLIFFI